MNELKKRLQELKKRASKSIAELKAELNKLFVELKGAPAPDAAGILAELETMIF